MVAFLEDKYIELRKVDYKDAPFILEQMHEPSAVEHLAVDFAIFWYIFFSGRLTSSSRFQNHFLYVQYKEQEDALRRCILNNYEFFSKMSFEAATATGTLLKNHTWFDGAISKFSDKGKIVAYYEMGCTVEDILDL